MSSDYCVNEYRVNCIDLDQQSHYNYIYGILEI